MKLDLARWLSCLERCPVHKRFRVQFPVRAHIGSTNRCFFHTDVSLPFPLSLKINKKHHLKWELKKKNPETGNRKTDKNQLNQKLILLKGQINPYTYLQRKKKIKLPTSEMKEGYHYKPKIKKVLREWYIITCPYIQEFDEIKTINY